MLPIVSMSVAQLTVQDSLAPVDEAGRVPERGRFPYPVGLVNLGCCGPDLDRA